MTFFRVLGEVVLHSRVLPITSRRHCPNIPRPAIVSHSLSTEKPKSILKDDAVIRSSSRPGRVLGHKIPMQAVN